MRLMVLPFCVMLSTVPAVAAPITYTFSGEFELSGSFVFDDAVPLVITTSTNGRLNLPVAETRYASDTFTMIGTFGGASFSGTPWLHALQWDDGDYQDHWIVRAPLTDLNGTLVWLNLFLYVHVPSVSLVPPTIPTHPGFGAASYAMALADGSATFGQLYSLQQLPSTPPLTAHPVPEPYSALLPWLGFGALLVGRLLMPRR